ncbi:hypothetical protein ApAK_07380, partial [Thermoplasmatales archaeon AK]|nr:hypothetical protein [Thermoplasmatales archaeon AK]
PTKIDLASLDYDLRFQVKLQVALLRNAQRIMEHYQNKEKFSAYISERDQKIRSLLGTGSNDVELYEDGNIIYP